LIRKKWVSFFGYPLFFVFDYPSPVVLRTPTSPTRGEVKSSLPLPLWERSTAQGEKLFISPLVGEVGVRRVKSSLPLPLWERSAAQDEKLFTSPLVGEVDGAAGG